MTFAYRIDSEMSPHGWPRTRQVAHRNDGTTITLVGIDREETLKFEYANPQTKAFFYGTENGTDAAITFVVFQNSIFLLDGQSPTQEQREAIVKDIAEALAGWPDDWTDDSGSNSRANTVSFV